MTSTASRNEEGSNNNDNAHEAIVMELQVARLQGVEKLNILSRENRNGTFIMLNNA